jgi:hypothetical protein
VIYAHADGGFSVWDPARNYWKTKGNVDVQDRLPGYVFSQKEVWDGLWVGHTLVCKGLLADWSIWIRENQTPAKNMAAVLRALSPGERSDEQLKPGPLTRIDLDSAQDIPSLTTGYSDGVPILHASSGVRRIVALAYMLLWTWQEHRIAARQIGEANTSQVVFLIDEIESHLHPRWQRTILTSILKLMDSLHMGARTQLITATHSPLIMASAESSFDRKKDAWFDLDLEDKSVVLRNRPFVRRGDVSNWLTSEAFDLKESRSLEAEQAILKAMELLRKSTPTDKEVESVDKQLRATLGEIDRFWVRWTEYRNQRRRGK